jgi:hypothetical protein
MANIGIDPAVAITRSRVGTAAKGGDPKRLEDARRELAAAKLADYINRTIRSAPPLTPEQRDRLAVLLRGAA